MISVPSTLLFPLLVKNPKKAQALTLYVALCNAGGVISGRRIAPLIDMSVTQTAAWILEFDEAIKQENRTLPEHYKPLKCDVSCTSTKEKPNTSRTVSKRSEQLNTSATPSGTASREVPANNPSHVGTRTLDKGSPLKGEPSTGTHEGRGYLSPSLKAIREFEEIFRTEIPKLTNLQIQTNSGNFVKLRKRFLTIGGKVLKSADSLKIWHELFNRRSLILKAIEAARTLPSSVVEGGETILNAILIVKKDGIVLSGTRVVA